MSSDTIYPPHRIFYLESLFAVTTAAMKAIDDYTNEQNALAQGEAYDEDVLFHSIQNIVNQAGSISKYFWPSRTQNQTSLNRAVELRRLLSISDDSLLQNRSVRNSVEHFDERLDALSARYPVGIIMPRIICFKAAIAESEVPIHYFQAYHPDTLSFSILGDEMQLEALIEEIFDLHEKLEIHLQRG